MKSSGAASLLFLWLIVPAAHLALSNPAWGKEPTPTELVIARKLFREATEFELRRRWQQAAAKLREAIQIKDTPGLRFHLAHCEEKMGLLVEAMLNYERTTDLLATGARAPDVEAVLEPARRALEQRLPTLLIATRSGIHHAKVELNGRKLAGSIVGRSAPVNPGKYRIVVTAPGYSPFAVNVLITEGERARIQADLKRLDSDSTNSMAASERTLNARSPTLAYVLLGESVFTLAALGVGVGHWLVKNAASDRMVQAGRNAAEARGGDEVSSCYAPGEDDMLRDACEALDIAASDYRQARVLAYAGFIGAGVGAASIALTLAFWPEAKSPPKVTAIAHKGGAFLAIQGSF